MDTWNTTLKSSRTRLTKALFVLETLCDEANILILDSLRERGKMTLAELYFQTGQAPEKLETRLESLCETGTVIPEPAAIGNNYRLDPERIWQINGISRRINQIREEALREQSIS